MVRASLRVLANLRACCCPVPAAQFKGCGGAFSRGRDTSPCLGRESRRPNAVHRIEEVLMCRHNRAGAMAKPIAAGVVEPPRHGPTGSNEGRALARGRADSRPRGDQPRTRGADLPNPSAPPSAPKDTVMSHSTDPTPPPVQGTSRRHRLIRHLRVIKARLRAATWRTVCLPGSSSATAPRTPLARSS